VIQLRVTPLEHFWKNSGIFLVAFYMITAGMWLTLKHRFAGFWPLLLHQSCCTGCPTWTMSRCPCCIGCQWCCPSCLYITYFVRAPERAISPDISVSQPLWAPLGQKVSFPRVRLLLETSKMDIAPLSLLSWMLGVVLGVLDVTYLCWIQAARIIAPETCRHLPLQSSSVIPVSTATALLPYPSPSNVILDNAPLSLLS